MTTKTRAELVADYVHDVCRAQTEQARKERLIVLLKDLFKGAEAAQIISDFVSGSEHRITNIERPTGKGSGAADTQYHSTIIEFEKDLRKTGEHAKLQLCEYLTGNWNSRVRLEFTLIATDCLVWEIYAPDFNSLTRLGVLKPSDVRLEKCEAITLTPCSDADKAREMADNFYFFLDRHLFRLEPIPATLDAVRNMFGHDSSVYRAAIACLNDLYSKEKDSSTMQVAYSEWHKFLSIAYGKFDASEDVFLTQSYLSILSKLLAYSVLAGNVKLEKAEINDILTGTAFRKHNIQNFCDDDFFRWTADTTHYDALLPAFCAILMALSRFDFSNVHQDILKGVYQELVDEDTRHSLGEYYTPDWLCAMMIEALGIKSGQKILDPTCGSGSFLKSVANELCKQKPDITASELNESLYGIDIHPLSVQISKATVLMSMGAKLRQEKEPINLHVYLANTLLLSDEVEELFGKRHTLTIDGKQLPLPSCIFDNADVYDKLVDTCNTMAEADAANMKPRESGKLRQTIKATLHCHDETIIDGAEVIYKALYEAKTGKRNGIWAFILKNTLRPTFLRRKFDLIVGNPPWVKFANVENEGYQQNLQFLAQKYDLSPGAVNMPNLEIAALFLAHTCNYFLKKAGRLAFVMPRAFFSGAQHEPTRTGKIKDTRVDKIWDLMGTQPLFKVPSCVIFATVRKVGKQGNNKIAGQVISGTLNGNNIPLTTALPLLHVEHGDFFLSNLGRSSAWTFEEERCLVSVNDYRNRFKRGACMSPRAFYFVDIVQEYDGDLNDRLLTVKTTELPTVEFKEPWKKSFKGSIKTNFLFRTALAHNILPFVLNGTYLVLLPIRIEDAHPVPLTPDDMELEGELETAKWFKNVSQYWERHRTERAKSMNLLAYLDFQRKLTNHNMTARYIVLYNKSGTHVCATVVDRSSFADSSFVVDFTAYYFVTDNEVEAYFVTAFLNAPIVNKYIKPFQTRGIMGERDITKKILSVPLPLFDANNPDHVKLANAGKRASRKAAKLDLTTLSGNLGRLRSAVRTCLAEELTEIDRILKVIWG